MYLLWLWTLGGLRVRLDKLAGLCTCMMEAVVDSQQGTCPYRAMGAKRPCCLGFQSWLADVVKSSCFLWVVGSRGVIVDQSPALLSNRAM
jgi:hypothetical protein